MRTKARSGSARKTGRPAEIDPSQLLDAAEMLFAEKGFAATTTRELVKQAKCNLALISYHFGGKDGLYQAVLLRHLDRLQLNYSNTKFPDSALVREWPELEDAAARRFCSAIHELSKGITADSPMQKIVCREMLTGAVKMAAALKRSEGGAFRFISALIVELQKEGKVRQDIDLRYCVIGILGPVVYSCVAAPLLKEIYGFGKLDAAYVRGLCLHQTKVFFEGCGTN